ncbi:nitroreductase family protein [soil metagenome]
METSSIFESTVLDIIKDRRSRRAFSDKPIESEKIKSIFEAARWAPSSMNDQPWTYIYATKGQPELWNKLFDTLNENNKVWAAQAPLLVLSLVRKHFTANGRENRTAQYDLGGANAFLTLQAMEFGLNTHQMGGYDHQKAIENLNIPDTFELGVMIAIGYNGDPENLNDNLKLREQAPRHRYRQEHFVMNKTF